MRQQWLVSINEDNRPFVNLVCPHNIIHGTDERGTCKHCDAPVLFLAASTSDKPFAESVDYWTESEEYVRGDFGKQRKETDYDDERLIQASKGIDRCPEHADRPPGMWKRFSSEKSSPEDAADADSVC